MVNAGFVLLAYSFRGMVGNKNTLPTLQEWEWWATKTRPYKNGNGGQQKPVTHPTTDN